MVRDCVRQRLSTISIGIGIAIGIGIEFGRAWLIRLQFFEPTVFEAEDEAEPEENRQSRKHAASGDPPAAALLSALGDRSYVGAMSNSPSPFRPHPWHGIEQGARYPEIVIAYIEIVPTDGVKYEIDKRSGYLKVDRPQRFSSFCPTLYGFVPRTYCMTQVAACEIAGAPAVTRGDGDPLDICVLTDRPIARGELMLEARPIGGLRMVEKGEADDKIIAVLVGDPTFGDLTDIARLPRAVVDRLRHYFLTYKTIPGDALPTITVDPVYDAAVAHAVLIAARADYDAEFPAPV